MPLDDLCDYVESTSGERARPCCSVADPALAGTRGSVKQTWVPLRGLQRSADDYVAEPFSAAELVARVAAVLRRSAEDDEQPSSPMVFVGLQIEPAGQSVKVDGRPVVQTQREFHLLAYMAAGPGEGVPTRRAHGSGMEIRVLLRDHHGARPHPQATRDDRARSVPTRPHRDRLGCRLPLPTLRSRGRLQAIQRPGIRHLGAVVTHARLERKRSAGD